MKARVQGQLARVPGAMAVARLTVETIRVCLRYRVTGLASEAGFFMLLSLPPLLLGLFGGLGYVGQWLGQDTVEPDRSTAIHEYAAQFLTEDLITETLLPTVQDVLETGRVRPDLAGLPALALVGLARAQRLRRHHLDHVRAVRRAGHRPHPGAVVLAVLPVARWSA